MTGNPNEQGDASDRRRPAPPAEVLIGGLPAPQVTHEEGVFVVTTPFPRSLAGLRFFADPWSLRFWLEGQHPPLPREVLFAGRIDPRKRIVRLSHGVLEFRFADAAAAVDAPIEPPGEPFD